MVYEDELNPEFKNMNKKLVNKIEKMILNQIDKETKLLNLEEEYESYNMSKFY